MIDVKDVMLEAAAEVQDVVREVMRELMGPQRVKMIRAMWMQAPEAMKEQFAQEHPEEYRMMMDELNE